MRDRLREIVGSQPSAIVPGTTNSDGRRDAILTPDF